MRDPTVTYLELFAGAGGLSLCIYRNPRQPYSPAVLAWTFACLCALCYAWGVAFFWDRTPLATWGHDDA